MPSNSQSPSSSSSSSSSPFSFFFCDLISTTSLDSVAALLSIARRLRMWKTIWLVSHFSISLILKNFSQSLEFSNCLISSFLLLLILGFRSLVWLPRKFRTGKECEIVRIFLFELVLSVLCLNLNLNLNLILMLCVELWRIGLWEFWNSGVDFLFFYFPSGQTLMLNRLVSGNAEWALMGVRAKNCSFGFIEAFSMASML